MTRTQSAPVSQVTEGVIVLREWAPAHGLRERSHTFHSLDELYALCVELSAFAATDMPQVIDRIIIQGLDAHAAPRMVTFVFQSITVNSVTPSE